MPDQKEGAWDRWKGFCPTEHLQTIGQEHPDGRPISPKILVKEVKILEEV